MSLPKDFYERVYDIVRQIPYGRVTSYGAVARAIYAAGSARMVGYALSAAVNLPDIPAHRVVNRNGLLTGKHHFGGSFVMQQLLESEGVVVAEDQVVHFKKLFWDPLQNLENLEA
jgi:methylated-DNA-protein-cysteine methyltransferase-like protein